MALRWTLQCRCRLRLSSLVSGFNAIFTFEDALILNTVTNEEAVARLIAARRAAAVCC